ncbi:Cullin-3 [Allomyces javanicus]|nr:Cullin-3 [Allomyces javanicus]
MYSSGSSSSAGGSAGAHRRVKIRPVRKANDSEHDASMDVVLRAMDVIYRRDASSLSFEEIYRSTYTLVLHKRGDDLHRRLLTTMQTILAADVAAKLAPLVGAGAGDFGGDQGRVFLRAVAGLWDHFATSLKLMGDVLMYMDKNHCRRPPKNLPSSWELGLLVFRDHVLRSTIVPVRATLRACLLDQIAAERNGDVIDPSLMRRVLTMLVDLGHSTADPLGVKHPTHIFGETVPHGSVYQADFETAFLAATIDFYKAEAQRLVPSLDVAAYLVQCETRLQEEERRVQQYVHVSTLRTLLQRAREQLLSDHVATLLQTGLATLLFTPAHDPDLNRLFRLLEPVPDGHSKLLDAIAAELAARGAAIHALVTDDARDPAVPWMDAVLALDRRVTRVLTACFAGKPEFEKRMQTALAGVVHAQPKAAELMAQFLDVHLRRGAVKKGEDEIEAVLKDAVKVLHFLHDKDTFERFYNQHLARRLLRKQSSSEELEKAVIADLRTLGGSQFTTRFEKMLGDMSVSRDLAAQFKDACRAAETRVVDLSVNVLTSSLWPVAAEGADNAACVYPAPAQAALTAFEQFYAKRHPKRVLTWLPHLGTAELKANFPRGAKELSVTTFAMVVLMLFNDRDALRYEDIRAETNIPEPELKRTLQSLSLGKVKVLVKSPPTKEVAEGHQFTYNGDFKDAKYKIKVSAIAARADVDAERAQTLQKVEEERAQITDATVVRIMKARKTMAHNELVTETVRQLSARFMASPALVKKRIESLIEREFLERAAGAHSVYNYLA